MTRQELIEAPILASWSVSLSSVLLGPKTSSRVLRMNKNIVVMVAFSILISSETCLAVPNSKLLRKTQTNVKGKPHLVTDTTATAQQKKTTFSLKLDINKANSSLAKGIFEKFNNELSNTERYIQESDSGTDYLRRAWGYEMMGKVERAREMWKKCCAADSIGSHIYSFTDFEERNLNFAEAYRLLAIQKSDSSWAEFWEKQGVKEKENEAREKYIAAIREDIKKAQEATGGKSKLNDWSILTYHLFKLGRTKEALAAASNGIPVSLINRAEIYEKTGAIALAEADLLKATVELSEYPIYDAERRLAEFYARTNNNDKALSTFLKEKKPFDLGPFLQFCVDNYKTDVAKEYLEKSLHKDDASHFSWCKLSNGPLLATILERMEDRTAAEELRRVLCLINPDASNEIWFRGLSQIYIDKGDSKNGLRCAEVAKYLSGKGLPQETKYIAWNRNSSTQVASNLKPAQIENDTLSPNSAVGDKWAIVVGVSKFKDESIPKLKYASKDARDFYNYLVREAKFAPDHVRLLLDGRATKERIVTEIGDTFLPRVVRPNDLVVLYFSTHGSPSEKDVRKKNFLVAYDTTKTNLYAKGLEMQNLTDMIADRVGADRVLIVLDACHSGGIGGDKAAFGESLNLAQLQLGKGQLLVSSCSPVEKSYESRRYNNGIFTKLFIDGLRNQGSKGLTSAFEQVRESVADEARADNGKGQNPQIHNEKWQGNDLVLHAIPSKPHAIDNAVKSLLEQDDSLLPAQ